MAEVREFKYLGSTVQSNVDCGRDLKKRVQDEVGGDKWQK